MAIDWKQIGEWESTKKPTEEPLAIYNSANDALCACDLHTAKVKFLQAGEAFSLRASQGDSVDKRNADLLNASICYLLADQVGLATSVLVNVREPLDTEAQRVLSELRNECRQRSASNHHSTMLAKLRELRKARDHKGILEWLKENPFILEAYQYAKQFHDSCRALGMIKESKLFEEDMRRLKSGWRDVKAKQKRHRAIGASTGLINSYSTGSKYG